VSSDEGIWELETGISSTLFHTFYIHFHFEWDHFIAKFRMEGHSYLLESVAKKSFVSLCLCERSTASHPFRMKGHHSLSS
jgi:hypothetical protein